LLQFGRQIAEVYFIQAERRARHDALHGRAVDLQEDRAQDLVSFDDLEPGAFEQVRGDAAFQTPAHGHVVSRVARVQPVEQPESLLGHRTGEIHALSRRGGVVGRQSGGRDERAVTGRSRQRCEQFVRCIRHKNRRVSRPADCA
jgi:hypothetical protein